MAKRAASAHDKEEPKPPSRSSRQGKVVSIKKDTKKPARQKATKTTMAASAEPMVDSLSVNGDINARIAERAYELHHHRGGHHGQDLEDWLTAEREVLSEESC
jgi:DUF2934 family protein